MHKGVFSTIAILLLAPASLVAAEPAAPDTSRGDRLLADYFRHETGRLAADCLADVRTGEDWFARRGEYRRQLFEMLGLDPLPERTPLEPVITGSVEHDEFTVEKLHFQSRPGLYVTGNLYLPKGADGPAPTVLYVCGHGRVAKDGISYGNKAHYQHHGAWFARHGYVCLTIDTLQLGEIEGLHHGTYREGMWWWKARGYTPAGVEAWNSIRALDYLETRPEVDSDRMGVTGRSGGGAYSWWLAALDDRIKVAVPVAGITSQQNHIVDGCVEGHCDCMYMVNTYRWDFPLLAALVAPRPLLISNTDKDGIFPLDGVVDVYVKARRIYELLGAGQNVGLNICEGPHSDTQELRINAFHWFNRYLKEEDPPPLIETAAVRLFEPEQLKVFDDLPADEENTRIHETFVPAADPPAPASVSEWERLREDWMAALADKSFRGWPREAPPLDLKTLDSGDGVTILEFSSQAHVPLRLYLLRPPDPGAVRVDSVVLDVLDVASWTEFQAAFHAAFPDVLPEERPAGPADPQAVARLRGIVEPRAATGDGAQAVAFVAPRGIGPTVWTRDERRQTQIRRRFMLLGQTRDGMRVWDVRRAVQTLRSLEGLNRTPLRLQAHGPMAGVALYAALFEPEIAGLELWRLPASHREGPIFLNVLRFLDLPQAVAMAAERFPVRLHQDEPDGWEYPRQVATTAGWDKERLQVLPIEAK